MREGSRAEAPARDRAAPERAALTRRADRRRVQRMAGHWMTVAAVTDPHSGEFLGTVTSHDLLDLVALMDEIEDEVQRRGADA